MDKFTCTRFLIFLLIFYFWWCWVFAAPRGLCLVAESGASPCSCLPLLLGTQAQARRLRGLQHPGPGAPALTQTPSTQALGLVPSGFRTSGPRAQLPHSMGNLLGLEIEPCSLHGEANSFFFFFGGGGGGEFLSTALLGMSCHWYFKVLTC